VKNKIKSKTIIEALIAVSIPAVYFFMLGGFNSTSTNEQKIIPYDPLSVIKRDFVNDITSGKSNIVKKECPGADKEYENSKIKKLASSERLVFSVISSCASTGDFYFKNTNGYTERNESCTAVLYISSGSYADGKEPMKKCYIAQDVNSDIQLKHDTAGSWYLKPKMKIRTADFSPGDARPLIAVITCGFGGSVIDSTVIRIRDFSDLNGKYDGRYLEKYMTEFEMPGDNLRISSAELFKDARSNKSGFNIKIFWFGEVDVWFEKITMDDDIANRLLSGNYDYVIAEETTPEIFLHISVLIRENKFTNSNTVPLNYVMNIIYDHLQSASIPNNLKNP